MQVRAIHPVRAPTRRLRRPHRRHHISAEKTSYFRRTPSGTFRQRAQRWRARGSHLIVLGRFVVEALAWLRRPPCALPTRAQNSQFRTSTSHSRRYPRRLSLAWGRLLLTLDIYRRCASPGGRRLCACCMVVFALFLPRPFPERLLLALNISGGGGGRHGWHGLLRG